MHALPAAGISSANKQNRIVALNRSTTHESHSPTKEQLISPLTGKRSLTAFAMRRKCTVRPDWKTLMSRETVTERNKRVRVRCDVCRSIAKHSRPCRGCGQDVCINCADVWHTDPFTGEDGGDYPPYACKQCAELSEKYSKGARNAQEKADSVIADQINAWRIDCEFVSGARKAFTKD